MADVGDNNFIRYIYWGEEGEIIPREATHITVSEYCTFVRVEGFFLHPNIVEVICHNGVKKIGERAFCGCSNLRRVIMPGVKIVENAACGHCNALMDVECGKLEIIGKRAFDNCRSLKSINLPSAIIVDENAFSHSALTNVKFGSKLERFEGSAFYYCESLERITIPLKDGMITADNIFTKCEKLTRVDLVEGELDETVAALHFKGWKNDMSAEIDSINQILPTSKSGGWDFVWGDDEGEMALAIRRWIRSVIGKIIHYRTEHERLLNETATTLQLVLPHDDILTNSVLPFLELPAHAFEVEYLEEGENEG